MLQLLHLPLLLLPTSLFGGSQPDSTTPYVRDAKSMEIFVAPAPETTTIIMIRHAERSNPASADPPLSLEGMSRANEFAQLFSSIKVDRIYSTPFQRTRQTVTPLAMAKSVEITEYAANTTAAKLKQKILAEDLGKIVVVVGHSNTIPELKKELCGETAIITETDFDNIYVVKLYKNLRTKYYLEYGKLTR